MSVGNSIFFHYSTVQTVEDNATQEELIHRIEGHVLFFLRSALNEQVPYFVRPSTTSKNLESRNGIKFIGLQNQVC